MSFITKEVSQNYYLFSLLSFPLPLIESQNSYLIGNFLGTPVSGKRKRALIIPFYLYLIDYLLGTKGLSMVTQAHTEAEGT